MWVDGRPTWEGSGITGWLILFTSVALGFLSPFRGWLMSIAVAGWIAATGLINGNPSALFAFVLGFGGAFVGAYSRRLIRAVAR